MSSFSDTPSSSVDLPLREIPGGYGLPFFGAIKDRLDFYYKQGPEEFFRSRIRKYNSTVYRVNSPPGPFYAPNSHVVVLLDAISFPILFDNSKVEKRNVFIGTYFPSTRFTGGYRVCAYLDTSEPKHKILKGFYLSILQKLHDKMIPTLRTSLDQMFINLEKDLADKGEADFNKIGDMMAYDFLFRLFAGKSPSEMSIGPAGNKRLDKWLLLQLAPLITLGLKFLPNCAEDLALHTFPLPYFLVKSDYRKVHDEFHNAATELLNEAEKFGLTRDEASHNLMFMTGFNAYGGSKVIFTALMKYVTNGGEELHRRLREEIRAAVKEEGRVTLSALNKMPLVQSCAWEALRIEVPVAFQYGKARADIKINNHENTFVIKKGEIICGYQPIATRDPKIFDNPEDFVPDRFIGEGEKLVKYVYWSNGQETDEPTSDNKQCPAKNMVVLLTRVMLVEFFLRYDTFTADTGPLLLGSFVKFKSFTKAT